MCQMGKSSAEKKGGTTDFHMYFMIYHIFVIYFRLNINIFRFLNLGQWIIYLRLYLSKENSQTKTIWGTMSIENFVFLVLSIVLTNTGTYQVSKFVWISKWIKVSWHLKKLNFNKYDLWRKCFSNLKIIELNSNVD
jgi:hypothetical protein